MRRTTRHLFFLIALVVALGAGVYFEIQRETALLPSPLTPLNVQDIKSLTLRCAECRSRRFEKRVSGWWMLEPYPLRANQEAIARLLIVAMAPVRMQLDAKEYDPRRLGLDPPTVTVKFDDVAVDFGGEDPIEHDRYARIGAKLVRIPDRFGARLLESPEVEIDGHIVDPDNAVVEIRVDDASPRADVAAAWKSTIASQTQPAEKSDGATKHIVVTFADSKTLSFTLRRDKDRYALRRDDISLEYVLAESQVQALLGAPN